MTRSLVAQNALFSVFFEEVSHGRFHVPDYLVVAPRRTTTNSVSGVAVVPVYEGKIGLVRSYRPAIREYSWEIVRGFVEAGESPVDAALRELEEEIQLTCVPERLSSLGLIWPEAGVLAARIQLFAALDCVRKGQYVPNELGHTEFRLFGLGEIKDMIGRSEVQDATTAVACYKYAALLADGQVETTA
ncbi:MAG: NUDIX hydrolase [Chloroflexi bacterium]|nr:NUDIX hydrolase [Chloroflexota bacterium]